MAKRISSDQFLKIIKARGFVFISQAGSHANPTFAVRRDFELPGLNLRWFSHKVSTKKAFAWISGGGWAGSVKPS